MTAFIPKKKNYIGIMPLAVAVVLVVAAALWLLAYNAKVVMRHSLEEAQVELAEAKVENAEFKNKLYDYLNPEDLGEIVAERNLVKDGSPQFVHVALP